MDLYLDASPDFSKEAAFAARLGEGPENWPQELTSELLKQLPFLSDYDVNVNLDRVDEQRAFAFGYADVANKTERPEVEHTEAGLPHVRIPLVVIEGHVKPFSIFVDGERVLPLSEERMRETLFNPATFDLTTQPPRDPSLVEPLMPPQRSGIGMGGEYKMASVQMAKTAAMEIIQKYQGDGGLSAIVDAWMTKVVPAMEKNAFGHISKQQWDAIYGSEKVKKISDKYGTRSHPDVTNKVYEIASKVYGYHPKTAAAVPLIEAIAPTLRETDVSRFTNEVASDPTLVAGLQRAGVAETLVEVFDNTKRASADERLEALAERIEPTVVTIQKLPGGDFLVKSANVNAFAPDAASQGQVIPEQEAAEAIGPEQAQSMQPGQTATAVSEPVEDVDLAEASQTKAKVVEEFGQYKVQDAMGNSLIGHVFPKVLSWDGSFSEEPIALFTNGSAYAVQDAVAGEIMGKATNLPSDAPRGDGVFYSTEGGDACCTAPVTIGSAAAGPDGLAKFIGTDLFGNQMQISLMEGLKTPQRISDIEYALPDSWKFMRLNNQTQLIPDPMQMNKNAAVTASRHSVTLFFNGSYNLEGGCGLEKLSSDYRYDLDPITAEFMLGLLGVEGAVAKIKVAEARRKGHVKLSNLKEITTLSERFSESVKTASSLLEKIPELRRDLLREAASLFIKEAAKKEEGDENTVNNLLALNFINPENLETFIDYLPELEETSEKLAEMTLFSYLGMKEIPEGAVERSMKNLEEVILGLKAVAHSRE